MNTEIEISKIAEHFLTGLRTRDAEILRSILHADAVWSLPGTSLISGEARGADAVIRRAQTIKDHGVSFALKHLLVGHRRAALSLHNTAQRGSLVFDEHLATVLDIRDGRVTGINTYLSDIAGLNVFFAPPSGVSLEESTAG